MEKRTLTLRRSDFGRILGVRGSVIKSIRTASGASVEIQRQEEMAVTAEDREVYLSGTPSCVETAERLIWQHLEGVADEAEEYLMEETPIPDSNTSPSTKAPPLTIRVKRIPAPEPEPRSFSVATSCGGANGKHINGRSGSAPAAVLPMRSKAAPSAAPIKNAWENGAPLVVRASTASAISSGADTGMVQRPPASALATTSAPAPVETAATAEQPASSDEPPASPSPPPPAMISALSTGAAAVENSASAAPSHASPVGERGPSRASLGGSVRRGGRPPKGSTKLCGAPSTASGTSSRVARTTGKDAASRPSTLDAKPIAWGIRRPVASAPAEASGTIGGVEPRSGQEDVATGNELIRRESGGVRRTAMQSPTANSRATHANGVTASCSAWQANCSDRRGPREGGGGPGRGYSEAGGEGGDVELDGGGGVEGGVVDGGGVGGRDGGEDVGEALGGRGDVVGERKGGEFDAAGGGDDGSNGTANQPITSAAAVPAALGAADSLASAKLTEERLAEAADPKSLHEIQDHVEAQSTNLEAQLIAKEEELRTLRSANESLASRLAEVERQNQTLSSELEAARFATEAAEGKLERCRLEAHVQLGELQAQLQAFQARDSQKQLEEPGPVAQNGLQSAVHREGGVPAQALEGRAGTMQRVRELRHECFSDDVAIFDDMVDWDEPRLIRYFEKGGCP